jgi:hypothetical protein
MKQTIVVRTSEDPLNQRALIVLDKIRGNKGLRANRLRELLKNPEVEYTLDWYMCVPRCFNDALDIKKTTRVENREEKLVWTQGSTFTFKVGDIIYDNESAYSLPWQEAIHKIHLSIQVTEIRGDATAINKETEFSGRVVFQVLTPDVTTTRLENIGEGSLSNQEFVKFLISGPEGDLKNVILRKMNKSG